MSKQEKRKNKRLHLVTRLVLWAMIALAEYLGYTFASIVLAGAWLFIHEMEQFERHALKLLNKGHR